MVTPERDVPGHERERLGAADQECVAPADAVFVALAPPETVGDPHEEAEHGEQRRNRHGIAQLLLDEATEGEPDDADRHGAEDHAPGQARIAREPAARQGSEPRARHGDEFAAEVSDHRE